MNDKQYCGYNKFGYDFSEVLLGNLLSSELIIQVFDLLNKYPRLPDDIKENQSTKEYIHELDALHATLKKKRIFKNDPFLGYSDDNVFINGLISIIEYQHLYDVFHVENTFLASLNLGNNINNFISSLSLWKTVHAIIYCETQIFNKLPDQKNFIRFIDNPEYVSDKLNYVFKSNEDEYKLTHPHNHLYKNKPIDAIGYLIMLFTVKERLTYEEFNVKSHLLPLTERDWFAHFFNEYLTNIRINFTVSCDRRTGVDYNEENIKTSAVNLVNLVNEVREIIKNKESDQELRQELNAIFIKNIKILETFIMHITFRTVKITDCNKLLYDIYLEHFAPPEINNVPILTSFYNLLTSLWSYTYTTITGFFTRTQDIHTVPELDNTPVLDPKLVDLLIKLETHPDKKGIIEYLEYSINHPEITKIRMNDSGNEEKKINKITEKVPEWTRTVYKNEQPAVKPIYPVKYKSDWIKDNANPLNDNKSKTNPLNFDSINIDHSSDNTFNPFTASIYKRKVINVE